MIHGDSRSGGRVRKQSGARAPVYTSESPCRSRGFLKINSGGDLLSHTVSRAVPSALKGLTAVFGMGTGVSPSLEPPET